MRPVDKLLAIYLAFLTIVIVARGGLTIPAHWWLLLMHGLVALLFFLFSRLRPADKVGGVIHDLYPLLLLPVLYSELGMITVELDVSK